MIAIITVFLSMQKLTMHDKDKLQNYIHYNSIATNHLNKD